MVALDGASIGLQAGGTSTDIVALFMAPEAIESMLSGDIEFGVDAAVAAGREATAETSDLEDGRNVVVYSRSDGLFAGVSLDGVSLRPDEDANEALYGTDISARALLSDSDSSQIPADVSQFVQSLEAAAAGR
jgi:lipid-binding SYLF domain-containing protein